MGSQTRDEKRSRGTGFYSKPPLDHAAMAELLEARGLDLGDRERAERYLARLGYFRLSPYMIPFHTGKGDHQFHNGTRFDEILSLYVFDRKLRLLILDALERIEVAVRAATTDYMSVSYDDSHWYTNERLFRDPEGCRFLKRKLQRICQNKLEEADERERSLSNTPDRKVFYRSALEHYLLTYREPDLPPAWLAMELLTFGQLEKLVASLPNSDQTHIAQRLGITAPLLKSWLRVFLRVRNICAHHGRLWNVGLGVSPAVPRRTRKKRAVPWPHRGGAVGSEPNATANLYSVVITIRVLLKTISPRSTWVQRIETLVNAQPDYYRVGMGFPKDWEQDTFWQKALASTPRNSQM